MRNSMEGTVIETSFAKESGFGNAVYSNVASQRNSNYMGQLFGPKRDFTYIAEMDDDT